MRKHDHGNHQGSLMRKQYKKHHQQHQLNSMAEPNTVKIKGKKGRKPLSLTTAALVSSSTGVGLMANTSEPSSTSAVNRLSNSIGSSEHSSENDSSTTTTTITTARKGAEAKPNEDSIDDEEEEEDEDEEFEEDEEEEDDEDESEEFEDEDDEDEFEEDEEMDETNNNEESIDDESSSKRASSSLADDLKENSNKSLSALVVGEDSESKSVYLSQLSNGKKQQQQLKQIENENKKLITS